MKIYIGADHAGFEYKADLIRFLEDDEGHTVEDLGAYELDTDDDYPGIMRPVAEAVVHAQEDGEDALGVILGGSGQGEAMAANRVPGARAIVYYGMNEDIVRLGREHNDANIISLGARFMAIDEAQEACKIFIDTFFSEDERHIRRIQELS